MLVRAALLLPVIGVAHARHSGSHLVLVGDRLAEGFELYFWISVEGSKAV